jgi:BASS family bile acid:Na+ symporter
MKTLLLIGTIFLGMLFPLGHSYAYLIQYLLMIMLFFSFLQMNVSIKDFRYNHLTILAINICVPIILYFLLKPINLQLAQASFITAFAPTAVAAPIIINILKGRVEFTVISILLTNFVIAFLLPFLMPIFSSSDSNISTLDVLIPVSIVFLTPYFLAFLIRKYAGKLKSRLTKLNKFVFYILVVNINLGTSKASYYIRQEMSFSDPLIYMIIILSLLVCIRPTLISS